MHELNSQFLIQLREQITSISQEKYPDGFFVSEWWTNIQKKNIDLSISCTSVEELVNLAQQPSSGFDHRRELGFRTKDGTPISLVIKKRYSMLSKLCERQTLEFLPGESVYSSKETLIQINNKFYSNVFLYHLYMYLRVEKAAKENSIENTTILEIGGGYGGLARIFAIASPDQKYIICDLAESLYFSYIFLKANLPEKKIVLVDSNEIYSDADIVLVPVQFCSTLQNYNFTSIINTGSLQEMPSETISFWMGVIKDAVGDGFFFSFNYFLNDNRFHIEKNKDRMNKTTLFLDGDWEIKNFVMNPEAVSADVELRNWLEMISVLKSKDEASSFSGALRFKLSDALSERISGDDLFKYLWNRYFTNPHDESTIIELLKSINAFKRGLLCKINTAVNKSVKLLDGGRITPDDSESIYYPLYGEEVYLMEALKRQQ